MTAPGKRGICTFQTLFPAPASQPWHTTSKAKHKFVSTTKLKTCVSESTATTTADGSQVSWRPGTIQSVRFQSKFIAGEFKSGEVTARTPICALAFSTIQLQVYYRNRQGHLVYVKNTGDWGRPNVIEGIGPGHNFAVLQWENGTLLRIYHQESSGAITELCSDNGGQSWFRGELRVGN